MKRTQGIAVLLTVLAVAGLAGYGVRKASRSNDPATRETDRVASQLETDRSTLRDRKAEPSIVFSTILRLGAFRRPEDKAQFLSFARDVNPLFRSAAAETLGNYDDADALEAIQGLLADPESQVRAYAARGLGSHAGAGRQAALEAWLAAPGRDAAEKISGLAGLIRIAGADAARQKALTALIGMARISGPDEKVAADSLQALLEVAPNDAQSTRLFEETLASGHVSRLQPLVIRGLARRKSAWLGKNFARFIESGSALNRLEAIRALPLVCPPERWPLLESRLKSEDDRTVLQFALKAPELMPGAQAAALLEKLLKAPSLYGKTGLRPDEIRIAEDGLKTIRTSRTKDPCAG